MLRSVWLMMVVIPAVLAYNTGPPSDDNPTLCATMLPGHGTSTVTGPAPYAIDVNTNEYKKAESIEVTLSATEADGFFRGFFLQARRKDGSTAPVYGSFISDPEYGTQFIKCGTFNSAWGHANREKKTSVSATWMGPSSDIGTLYFNATVVGNDRTEYWTNIVSEDITFGSAMGVKSQGFVLSVMAVIAYVMRV